MVGALEQAVAAFDASVADLAVQLEEQALRLAREPDHGLLGRELALATDPAGDVVTPCARRAARGRRADPGPRAPRRPQRGRLRGADRPRRHDRRRPDLDVHDAVVETDTAYVDRGVDAALARVREVLS